MMKVILLALLSSQVAADKPTLELVFGIKCPACQTFARTLEQVFDADGIADAVNFKLSPDIFKEFYGGYGCIDEDNITGTMCDPEVYFLCAQKTVSASVHCLAAMDATSGSAKAKAQACAKAESADFSKIDACFNSDEANTLRAAAAAYHDKKKVGSVPHIEINGKVMGVDQRNKSYLISQLCATGIKAGACGGITMV